MKYTYKNNSSVSLHLVGHGIVKAGETIDSDEVIINPNFVKVSSETTTPQPIQITQTPAPQEEAK